jgi:hypothetical protein
MLKVCEPLPIMRLSDRATHFPIMIGVLGEITVR